jgi:hypothetical protein
MALTRRALDACGSLACCTLYEAEEEPWCDEGGQRISCFSNDQISELVRLVEQVSPAALHDFAMLFNQRSMGMGAFSASVALLLMRALHQKHSSGAKLGQP